MEDGNISGPSAVVELTWSHDVQEDHALTMVSLSCHMILDVEKSVIQLVDLTKSMKEDHRQDKLEEMEKSLTQLVEDLCLLLASNANPSQPETTTIPNSIVHEAVNPYPSDGWNSWVDKESMEKRVMRMIFCVAESDHCRDQVQASPCAQ
ncbi:unnamed protein product [Prunus armeniaca]|uniref:Uncharacterized protein n=1 Tax=Prunus armeniaca TaxID=36596 RepID=A0A6J5UWI6_PRUAR|nr:unnamed protein product [Prunus armeniaca]CAB4309944.1 unnamed protein product [Prunus armeniaca]